MCLCMHSCTYCHQAALACCQPLAHGACKHHGIQPQPQGLSTSQQIQPLPGGLICGITPLALIYHPSHTPPFTLNMRNVNFQLAPAPGKTAPYWCFLANCAAAAGSIRPASSAVQRHLPLRWANQSSPRDGAHLRPGLVAWNTCHATIACHCVVAGWGVGSKNILASVDEVEKVKKITRGRPKAWKKTHLRYLKPTMMTDEAESMPVPQFRLI